MNNNMPFSKTVFSGKAKPLVKNVRVELTNVGYSNLFIPINNGFVSPLKKLVGGRYPRGTPEEGGVTYGFGFHCHDDCLGCFTPVVSDEVADAFFELEFHAPRRIRQMSVRCRAGGNDEDIFLSEADAEWERHDLGELKGPHLHRFRLPLKNFDPDIAFQFDLDAEDIIYIHTARIIPFYDNRPDAEGAWSLSVSLPFPYGFEQKTFEYAIYQDDVLERIEKIVAVREEVSFSKNPTEAVCQWVLNRFAEPRLGARWGSFPLAYYDSFAKTFYASGQTMWIRLYMVMPLVKIAARRAVRPELLKGAVEYVCSSRLLEAFFPENRKGYLEYCGSGNFHYGAVAMLWQVTGEERLKELLLRFVGKYMDSQKVHTAMRAYPEQCHNYRGAHLLPTITTCGHEETMHAAVIEAYRVTHDPELLHEAVGEKGAGFLEDSTHGAVRVPARFENTENARDMYGYYVSLHTLWARSRDAIHYRAEGLIRLYEVTGNDHWVRLASRRASNYLRYIGVKVGNEFLGINFEYPQAQASQFQTDPSLNTSTGGSDGEYFQDIYTAAGLQQHYPMDAYCYAVSAVSHEGEEGSLSAPSQLFTVGREAKKFAALGSVSPTSKAFTLIELLVVISIIAVLMLGSGPMMQSMVGAGTVNKAIDDVSGCLQSARAYAMATHTYVRVAVGKVANNPAAVNPATILLVIFSADGTLDAGTTSGMSNSSIWPTLGKPIVLDNFFVDNTINGTAPDTSGDVLPSKSDISTFSRNVGGQSVSFTMGFIQFSPNGEARVVQAQSARYIKIAMDKSSGARLGQNPFIVRLSGISGAVSVLRKGEGIQ